MDGSDAVLTPSGLGKDSPSTADESGGSCRLLARVRVHLLRERSSDCG